MSDAGKDGREEGEGVRTAILDRGGDGLELLDHGRRVVVGHHMSRPDRHKVQTLHLSASSIHLAFIT
jgi:hypothetical protein